MVDCGYHRDGVDPRALKSVEIARRIVENGGTSLAGIYSHGGHSYDCASKDVRLARARVERVAAAERDAVLEFADAIVAAGVAKRKDFGVGVGSTPTCSLPPRDGLQGVDEMHPGNYVSSLEVPLSFLFFSCFSPFLSVPFVFLFIQSCKADRDAYERSATTRCREASARAPRTPSLRAC